MKKERGLDDLGLSAQFYAHPFKLEHMDLLDATLLLCLFSIVWISMAFEIALKETIEYEVLEGMARARLLHSPHSTCMCKPPAALARLVVSSLFHRR